MKIKKLHIKNFKSIADLEIIEPNPFTVFVGPNGSGKSNIFEALEFYLKYRDETNGIGLFGGEDNISKIDHPRIFSFETDDWSLKIDSFEEKAFLEYLNNLSEKDIEKNALSLQSEEFQQLSDDHPIKKVISKNNFYKKQFSRLFIKNKDKQKVNYSDNLTLSFSANNLEKVLKRILKEESKKEEILDWLRLFIPEFDDVFIESSDLSRTDTLIVKERFSPKYFTKELISDGTYNILALLTAVFQSDEPQFLCIEEPENGLTPDVIKEMVNFFRNACEEKGHYIWLNTHSQSLVSQLSPDEIITVNKIKGETKIKQFKGEDFNGLSMDEAWLTNTLGGGLPW
ncbi:AAA family ATPase [Flectobacillus sp. BAB-3569]|uniref:AAA family ATPase n=1 Tax=Flectobacillus sp. BAB-3569 TaxID=1509483 RepID=UPI000BA473AB|nr:ATP-binding protein [Flectobacillus sp. BAB-3569]NBA74247.1 AAA family ATPase [Emticicia sp. ODNR4P]PAC30690.1 chromosome segregation protein SMC [Flectobacillus sp. BAB-3569]